jgi:hypothetical protein
MVDIKVNSQKALRNEFGRPFDFLFPSLRLYSQ